MLKVKITNGTYWQTMRPLQRKQETIRKMICDVNIMFSNFLRYVFTLKS